MNIKSVKLWGGIGVIAVLGIAAVSFFGIRADAEPTANANNAAAAASHWSVRCASEDDINADKKRGKCEMYQRQNVKESGERVLEFAIGYPDGKADARGIFILPTGILLEKGVLMSIDENQPFRFDVRYCVPNGCYAYVNLNADVLSMMKKGNNAVVQIETMNNQAIQLKIPLTGFTKVLSRISS